MNLLRIQDALKNASDQQLMQLMQAPDSTAPSYLVLSEIRRRKDMRAKQAPEGQSNRTVAEDLTAPEDQGIRDMQMPEQPPQDVADQAGIEAMREGGVVRMQAGGDIPFPPSSYEDMTIPPAFAPRPGPGESLPMVRPLVTRRADNPRLLGAERELSSRFRADPRLRGDAAIIEQTAQQFGVSPSELRERVMGAPPAPVQAPGGVAALAPDMPRRIEVGALAEDEPRRAPFFPPSPDADRATFNPPATATTTTRPQGQQGQPGAGQGQPGADQTRVGGTGGGGTPAALAATEANAPTLAEIYRQNQGLFADGIGALRERAQQERVDPAARRSEAVNMALIEAGLRIAGSRNPSLIGAIGEGALPAVQSYGQQLGQIRAEQREARRDELELAKQDLNRQFAIGQISATEYRTRMDNVNANLRAASAERAASIRAGASEAAADRRATAAEAAADRRASAALELERVRAQNRPIDLSGIPSLISSTGTQIRDIQRELSLIGGEPPREIRGRPNPDHQRWSSLTSQLNDLNTEMAEYRRMIRSGLPTRGATGQTGGTTNLPSGARIVNGQYVPAGS